MGLDRTVEVGPIRVVRALALQAGSDHERAAVSFQHALEQGAAQGHLRSFLDEGPGVAALLGRMKAEGGRMQPYIARLLAAFPPDEAIAAGSDRHPSPFTLHLLPEPLTLREIELRQGYALSHTCPRCALPCADSYGD